MSYKKYLTEKVLPFWLKGAIDTEEGGIFTSLDREGNIYGRDKSVWFQGRSLWTFAKAYNAIERKEEYIAAAKRIFDFIPRTVDTDGRMFFTVDNTGCGIQKRSYYFSETFAAIGSAEYYQATKDKNAKEQAEKYFAVAKRCYDDKSKTPSGLPIKELALPMIMMNTARCLASSLPDGEHYARLAREFAEEIMTGGYFSEELGVLLEKITQNGAVIDSPTGRVVNPGHSLEAAWFLMVEGVLGHCDEFLAFAKKIIDSTMKVGIDRKYGGVFGFLDAKGLPSPMIEHDVKRWWPQNEAIIANRMAYELFGEEKYREAYESLCDYAFGKFADNEYGEWFGYLHYDGTLLNTAKGNDFKGPFHLPRMLMILSAVDEGRLFEFFG